MSVEIQIELQGADEYSCAMERLDKELSTQLQSQIALWAEKVKNEAIQLAPAKTGYLRSTIYSRIKHGQIMIGAEASYASAVEFGTYRRTSRPFLNPALQTHLPELERVLLAAIDAAKAGAGL